MVSVSARVFSIGAAAVLIMSGVPMLGVQAEPAAQAPAAPAASTLDPLVLKTLQWRSVGPARAGRSIAVSGVKGRPKEAYAGQTGGGLWKTVDGGESWLPVTDGKIHSSSVGAVAVSETRDAVISALLRTLEASVLRVALADCASREAALAIALALREAVARDLGVDTDEMGFAAPEAVHPMLGRSRSAGSARSADVAG